MEIAAGQYIDGNSPIHSLDPRAKLVAFAALVSAILIFPGHLTNLVFLALLLILTALAKIPPGRAGRTLLGLRFFVLMAFLVHLLFTPGPGGYDWWIFHLSLDGVNRGAIFALRLLVLIWSAALLGWTTPPISFSEGVERLASPLGKIGVPVRDLSTTLLLSMRFIPTLLRDARELRLAQKARGADFGKGGAISRVKSIVPLVVPLFARAFRRAEASALALTVRGYDASPHRTSLYPLRMKGADWLAVALAAALLLSSIALSVFARNT